ncbi:MAG: HAMP domain-containing histidine kinase [Peptococcaceae bacterium]|nr:HAMP domain-containing histidine kinase [Peptococcaceae bacterium]
MKPINRIIVTPFIILIMVFPLITLLFFNLSVDYYLDKNAKTELKGVVKTMESVVKKELPGNLRNTTAANLAAPFANLYRALQTSKLAVNTEMLFYTRNKELLNIRGDKDSFINNQLITRMTEMLPSMQDNKVYTIRIGTDKYFVLSYPLTDAGGPAVVFVSSADKEIALVHFINLILTGIMLLGALLAIWLARRLSVRITRPVSELCRLTRDIGSGEFRVPLRGTGDDILELHRLNQSIGEMSAKLEAYDKSQKAFLQKASHELKTPLMSIQGYAEGVMNGVLPDVKHAAQVIHSESKRLGTLVEELLTLSRIESQTYSKELAPVDLENILKEYIQRLGGLAAKHERKLLLTLSDKPVFVLADDALLSQAVTNIVSNCLRYAKTTVSITLLEEGNSAVIRVADDGEGIPKPDLPHIFERFYKGKGGNFGLGLAIAKSAVEFMGGSIRADNGQAGAVFIITLPKYSG